MQAKTDFDIVVVGGGIVGLASAYKIARSHPALRLAVLVDDAGPRLLVYDVEFAAALPALAPGLIR